MFNKTVITFHQTITRILFAFVLQLKKSCIHNIKLFLFLIKLCHISRLSIILRKQINHLFTKYVTCHPHAEVLYINFWEERPRNPVYYDVFLSVYLSVEKKTMRAVVGDNSTADA